MRLSGKPRHPFTRGSRAAVRGVFGTETAFQRQSTATFSAVPVKVNTLHTCGFVYTPKACGLFDECQDSAPPPITPDSDAVFRAVSPLDSAKSASFGRVRVAFWPPGGPALPFFGPFRGRQKQLARRSRSRCSGVMGITIDSAAKSAYVIARE